MSEPVNATVGTGSSGATATGVLAENDVSNNAAVVVNIGGGNYAPVTIVVETVTKIVNAGAALAETGANMVGGAIQILVDPSAAQRAAGALVSNEVDLSSDLTVQIAGDNRTPIRIVIEVAASIWNQGIALLGFGPDAASADGTAVANGLLARNRIGLSTRALINILGNNYAPIDIHIRLISETVNIGLAASRTAERAYESALPTADPVVPDVVRSGSASCLGAATSALIGNIQTAAVITPSDASGRRASNILDTTVGTSALVGCITGPVVGPAQVTQSGSVDATGTVTEVVVASVQSADASAVLPEPKASENTPVGTEPHTQPHTQPQPGAASAKNKTTAAKSPASRITRGKTGPGIPQRVRQVTKRGTVTYEWWYYEEEEIVTSGGSGQSQQLLFTLSTLGIEPGESAEAPRVIDRGFDFLPLIILALAALLFTVATIARRQLVRRRAQISSALGGA